MSKQVDGRKRNGSDTSPPAVGKLTIDNYAIARKSVAIRIEHLAPCLWGEAGRGDVAAQQIDNYAVKREQSHAYMSYAELTNE